MGIADVIGALDDMPEDDRFVMLRATWRGPWRDPDARSYISTCVSHRTYAELQRLSVEYTARMQERCGIAVRISIGTVIDWLIQERGQLGRGRRPRKKARK